MKPVLNVLAFFSALLLVEPAWALDGVFTVTEDWSVTLEYDNFAGGRFTGVKHFSGRETGTLVIHNGDYKLINRTGLQIQGNDRLLARSIDCFGDSCSIDGYYAFGPGYNARAYGILFLGCFVVKVPLVDGEVPIFYDFDYFEAYGDLSSMRGGGDMIGSSLTATVSSTLSITPKSTPSTTPPHVTAQPKDMTVDYGRKAVLSVHASGTPPLYFQWWKAGTPLPGENSPTLTLDQTTTSDAGNYSVVIANSFGGVVSDTATLVVRPPVPAIIKIQPHARTVLLGRKLRLVARAKGPAPLAYQWYFNDDPIAGANTNVFFLPAVQSFDGGNYFLEVNNPAGSVTSRVAVVTVKVPAR